MALNTDGLSAAMIVHAQIRRGLFDSALVALEELERIDPKQRDFVHDIRSMCSREIDQLALDTDASTRELAADMDLWSDRAADSPAGYYAQAS